MVTKSYEIDTGDVRNEGLMKAPQLDTVTKRLCACVSLIKLFLWVRHHSCLYSTCLTVHVMENNQLIVWMEYGCTVSNPLCRPCTEYSNVESQADSKLYYSRAILFSEIVHGHYVDSGPFTSRLLWAKRLSNMEGRLQKVIISVRAVYPVYQTTTKQ